MKMNDSYDLLIREYLDKVNDCDCCMASTFCTINQLRNSRYPTDYCMNNLKEYLRKGRRKNGEEI